MDNNTPPDLNSLSDEQLRAIASQPLPDANAAPTAPADPNNTAPLEGFAGFAREAKNAATVASQGLAQGLQNFQVGGTTLLRDVTDRLGLTSAAQTQAMRDALAQKQQATKAEADLRGSPTLGAVSTFAGEAIPNMLVGGQAFNVAKGLGAGAFTAGAASGALSGALPDNPDGQSRLTSAAIGGATGGILSKGAQFLSDKLALAVDPDKASAFAKVGIQPKASQVAVDPVVADSYRSIENKLATLPGGKWGKVGNNAQQLDQFAENLPKIVNELDHGPDWVPSSTLYKQAVDSPSVNAISFKAPEVVNSAKNAFKTLSEAKAELSPLTQQTLVNLAEDTPQTMQQMQQLKMSIDGQINNLAKNASRFQIKSALLDVRKAVSNQMDYIAQKNGVKRVLDQANQAYADEQFIGGVRSALNKSANNLGDPAVDGVKPGQFITKMNKAISDLQESGFKASPQIMNTVAALRTVGRDLLAAPKTAPGGLGAIAETIAGKSAVETGKLAAGAAFAYTNPVTTGVALSVAKGLQMMLASQTGINILAKMGNGAISSNAARLVLTTATALGTADMLKHPEMAGHPQSGHVVPDMNDLSDEQLKAIMAQPDAAPPAAAGAPEQAPQAATPASAPSGGQWNPADTATPQNIQPPQGAQYY